MPSGTGFLASSNGLIASVRFMVYFIAWLNICSRVLLSGRRLKSWGSANNNTAHLDIKGVSHGIFLCTGLC